ncbi:Uncharacterised protein [Vibrio cholerae]|nr:Uncharacterised protein [Vibrio cholerae]
MDFQALYHCVLVSLLTRFIKVTGDNSCYRSKAYLHLTTITSG